MEMMRIHSTEERTENRSQEKGCYTVEELMDILCVGRKAIYSLIHKRSFPALRIGSVGYRIPKAAFHAWLNQMNCAATD